jgi:hypothetical protein
LSFMRGITLSNQPGITAGSTITLTIKPSL